MVNYLDISLPPVAFLSFCSGILLIGSILYLYVFAFTRNYLYLSIAFLGITGYLYTGAEVSVIVFSLAGESLKGMQMHRIQALLAVFFIVALPFYILNLLHLTSFIRKTVYGIIVLGAVVFVVMLVSSFVFPELFIALSKKPGTLVTSWNVGRGTPGILYRIRDIFIFMISFWSIAMMLIEIRIHRRYSYVLFTFIGAIIAICFGVYDLSLAEREIRNGLFSIRVFSYFSVGVTIFILLSMLGVMKWFIDQSRLIERAKRLESLGIMAGGIAHDFNNLLTGITGNASLAKDGSVSDDERTRLLSGIESAAVRAKNLSYQLLTFSKGGAPVKNIMSIADIVRETADFVLRGSNVMPRFTVADELWHASVDANQISQVAQNIIINAQQAMPGGGVVGISLMNKSIATPSAHLTAGDYVVLEIRDHGTGISPEALHHVFDPYFTTKDNGSGLGLSISHSIITQHGGHIDVSSKPGEGTLFTIYLPAVKNIPPHVALPCEDIPGLSGRVLVLDDEQMILDLVENMLSAMGLESVCVSTGDEAVREYRAAFDAGNPFDIVIMDLTIPGDGGGKEAIHILREFDPKVRAIVSSGYSESSILSEYGDYGFSGVLPKPYTFDQLKKTIASVLRAC